MVKYFPVAFRYMKNVGYYLLQTRREMMQEKSCFGHYATKNEIFIAGGQDMKSSELSRVESYDIKKDTWRVLPPMKRARYLPTLCLFRQRFLYVFGGQNHSSLKNKPTEPAKFVSKIERLDVREGAQWEIINLRTEGVKIGGHSLNSLQISASEIVVFGSYFKDLSPCFEKILFFVFDHEKQTVRKCTLKSEDEDQMGQMFVDGSFTDSSVIHKNSIFAFNSQAYFDKHSLLNYHKFSIASLQQHQIQQTQ